MYIRVCINVCVCIHHLLFKRNLFSLTALFTPKERSLCFVQFRATAVTPSMMVHIRTSCSSSGLAMPLMDVMGAVQRKVHFETTLP